MSIASELTLLNNTKQGIKTAINNKGVTVTNEPFAEYPDKIRLIPNGGGIYESNIIAYIEGILRNAVIPSGTTTIGSAFCHFSALRSVTIPNTVTTIADEAFFNCVNLSSMNLPNSVTSIGQKSFMNCHSLTSLTIPDSVTSLGQECFRHDYGITNLVIGNGVTTIPANCFNSCSGISSITYGANITNIQHAAFKGAFTLTGIPIILPNGLLTIGSDAFRDCSSSTYVEIPSTVTSIGDEAFYNCSSLSYITVNATVPPTLGANAFYWTNDCPIYVPDNSLLDYQVAWSDYVSRITGISNKPQ